LKCWFTRFATAASDVNPPRQQQQQQLNGVTDDVMIIKSTVDDAVNVSRGQSVILLYSLCLTDLLFWNDCEQLTVTVEVQ